MFLKETTGRGQRGGSGGRVGRKKRVLRSLRFFGLLIGGEGGDQEGRKGITEGCVVVGVVIFGVQKVGVVQKS